MSDVDYINDDWDWPAGDRGSIGVRPATLNNDIAQLIRTGEEQPAEKPTPQPVNALAKRGILDQFEQATLKLFGPDRYQLWPERMVRSAATLPGDVYSGALPAVDPATGRTNEEVIQRVQDLAGIVGGGSMPMAAKGALGMAGGRMTQPTISKETGPFYSAVEHAVMNAPQERATPQQWTNWLRNQPGVKAEEMDWLGLNNPASLPVGAKGLVSKQDVLAHAQGYGPKIKEIEKKGTPVNEDMAFDRAIEETPLLNSRYFRNNEDAWLDAVHERQRELLDGADNATKFSDYQLPGGDNYRELLLTIPEKKSEDIRAYYKRKYPNATKDFANLSDESKAGMLKNYNEERGQAGQIFSSSHWDEPNVLAHVRMNDRQIPDVGKSLHLEEVQSDWHQQGRKQGYKSEYDASLQKVIDAERQMNVGSQLNKPRTEQARLEQNYTDESARHSRWMVGKSAAPLPDAPFKSTWADLALKRAIAKAAREGYDAISWTPGEQQAARYDLSKHLDTVEYSPETHHLIGRKGNTVPIDQLNVPPEKLADYVGKDVAEKLFKSEDSSRKVGGEYKKLSGLDLKVGGEGMKAFYDKMLVDKANAIAKKFGGKVEWKEIPHELSLETLPRGSIKKYAVNDPYGETRYFESLDQAQQFIRNHQALRVPVLRLTPKMKETATGRGLPLFMHGLPFSFTPVDGNPFEPKQE